MASTAQHIHPANPNPITSANVRARFAHVAVAEQVKAQGLDISKALYEAAPVFNAELFDGQLLPVLVEVTPPGSLNALADYRPRSAEGLDSCIRIGHSAAQRGLRFALDVLLHEMLHAYCQEVLEDLELGYAGHGPKWTAQCNRIGRMLGLPEVFVKGRGGPNSARWPLCVRPAGYYGFEEAQPGRPWKGPARTAEPTKAPADPFKAIRDSICKQVRKADPATLDLIAVILAEAANDQRLAEQG